MKFNEVAVGQTVRIIQHSSIHWMKIYAAGNNNAVIVSNSTNNIGTPAFIGSDVEVEVIEQNKGSNNAI